MNVPVCMWIVCPYDFVCVFVRSSIGVVPVNPWIGDVPWCPCIRASNKSRNLEVTRWQAVVIAGSPFIVIDVYDRFW